MSLESMTVFFFTGDDARAKAFYEQALGLRFASHGPHWHLADAGRARFALHGREAGDAPPDDLARPFIGFNVVDVAAVVARCRAAGARIVRDVYDESFGKVALVEDPEGRCVRFVQH